MPLEVKYILILTVQLRTKRVPTSKYIIIYKAIQLSFPRLVPDKNRILLGLPYFEPQKGNKINE